VQPGHAHVLVDDDFGPEQLCPDARLVQHRTVRRSAGDDHDGAAHLGYGACNPGETRKLVFLRRVVQREHGAACSRIRARHEDAAGTALEQRLGYRRHLLGRLSLCEHRLRRSLAELAMDVGTREAEVAERQLRDPFECAPRLDVAAPHALEQRLQVLAQARHEAGYVTCAVVTVGRQAWVGQGLPRLEDEALLRGQGRFIDDLEPVPNAGHAAIVRSQFAHARVRGIDVSAAVAHPGVIGVVTGADVAAASNHFAVGVEGAPLQYAAAVDEVRYVGEPVAVVVATDRYVAEDAAELVTVDYEPLDAVVDSVAAAAEWTVSDRSFSYGEPDAAFAAADIVVQDRFRFPRWAGNPLECYGVVCDWNRADASLTAWANFQGPFTLHVVAAGALGLPGSKLRLITPPDSGGSFGTKAAVYAYVVLLGVVSKQLGVPIRWIEDRLEHLAASASSTARVTDLAAAFAADGELLGLRYDVYEDVGAYVRAPEPATLYRMHGSLSGAYRVRNVAARNRIVLTNRAPTSLTRGFGGPQVYFALERTMEIAAGRLGLDPAELRRRNLVRRADFPYRTPSGGLYDSGDYEACLDQTLELARYDERLAWRDAARAEGRLAGIGLACVVEPSISNMGYITLAQTAEERLQQLPKSGNAEGATVAINPLGGITVQLSTTPQGQGHRTVAAQVAADVLGVSPGEIEVLTSADTSATPWTVASGSYSSRFSGVGAGAVHKAATRIAAKLKAIAAPQLGCAADEVELRDGKAWGNGDAVSLRRLAGAAHWNPDSLPPGVEPGLYETAFDAAPNLEPPDADDRVASSAAHGFLSDLAVVEVDRETGVVNVVDYVTVHDAGRQLNPLLVEGQVRGAFAHGAGAALYERVVYDEEGNLVTGTLMDYLCPTGADLPPLTMGHLETPSPFTTLGAKGLGEGTTMSAPAAIANAVADALGVDAVEVPLTPSRVWELLQR
jgi:2-furoyl-CoA dehydrogenase large subunit